MDLYTLCPVLLILASLISKGSSQCVVGNTTLAHNETQADCTEICTCFYGLLGCEPTCGPIPGPPFKDCPNPILRVPPGECCGKFVCEACPPGRWGNGCSKKCGQCASEDRQCNIMDGKCPPNTPLCMAGYFGDMCTESCPEGKYGLDCFFSCGNCAGGRCDVMTGWCLQDNPRCQPGWRGNHCQTPCKDGDYGPDCTSWCGECAAGNCDPTDGACLPDEPLCKAGFRGTHCHDACPPGRFGPECDWECGGCAAGTTKCKPQNGECPPGPPRCKPGYMGIDCKVCPRGSWGEECGRNCSEHCARGRLECAPRDGTCLGGCVTGYTSHLCEPTRSESSADDGTVVGLAVGLSVLILLLVSVAIQLMLYRYRHPDSKLSRISSYLTTRAVRQTPMDKTPEEGKLPESLGPCPPIPLVSREEFSFYETMLPSSNWKVQKDSLEIKKKFMVQGNFGETQLAKWHYTTDSPVTVPVGLKRFSGNGSDEKKTQTKKELRKLRSLERNINVLTILGTASEEKTGDTLLLLEWTDEGNLLDYLTRKRTLNQITTELSEETLIKFCLDVALAMAHLSSNKVFGVVLAAEKILLDKNFDAKVTGFFHYKGDEEITKEEKMVSRELRRWASLEYLTDKTNRSTGDIWGLGVLMWEVFSVGERPYSEFSVKDLREKLDEGVRLSHPALAPTTLYVLMTECWQTDPSLRPAFSDIVKRLQDVPSDNLARVKDDTYSATT